ncbi:MFS transporter [Kibdelosporangium phytohabitans]|uniref:MFS transporter n=1 Tax=Kibdelosporangium phytohabitans TaxID=860235 RepID=A0A0N9HVJ9_9PSEU|nr:MFS transporter [Kibdelosporangium phytohabitans]ALG09212.1 MFS transporter [Kibdelosporangium phytohabitans]MBE1469554.1 DHA2 family multidrug resistance protein-like MFS transporter [Kibdelosporangium phytohabitans]
MSTKEWAGLAVLALPTALLGLDVTVLYLTMPSLAADLDPTGTEVLWIMDAYGFLIAGFLITMGTLGDRIGRRRLLMIGSACFGAVSVVAAFAPNAEVLIGARAALGIAAATLMPSTLALISTMVPDPARRAVAIGGWVTAFALGMAAGPVVGGLLVEHFWWGAAFLVAIPIVVVVLLAGPKVLPEHQAPRSGRIDMVSVVLSLLALLPVIYAVKHVAEAGVGLSTVVPLVAGVGFGVLFVRRQRGQDDPLLDIRLFSGRTFSAALGVMVVGLTGVGGVMLLVTQYLQQIAALPPLRAGAWMGPPALAMFAAAIATPLIARRIRPAYVAGAVLAVSTVGYALLVTVDGTDDVVPVVAGFALVYLSLGTIAALGTDLVVGAVPPARAGAASALSETVQELGLALGVAVLGSIAAATYRAQVPADAAGPVRDSLAGALSNAGSVPETVIQQAKDAAISGLNVAALVAGIGVLVLAVLAAVVLRHVGTYKSQVG